MGGEFLQVCKYMTAAEYRAALGTDLLGQSKQLQPDLDPLPALQGEFLSKIHAIDKKSQPRILCLIIPLLFPAFTGTFAEWKTPQDASVWLPE